MYFNLIFQELIMNPNNHRNFSKINIWFIHKTLLNNLLWKCSLKIKYFYFLNSWLAFPICFESIFTWELFFCTFVLKHFSWKIEINHKLIYLIKSNFLVVVGEEYFKARLLVSLLSKKIFCRVFNHCSVFKKTSYSPVIQQTRKKGKILCNSFMLLLWFHWKIFWY